MLLSDLQRDLIISLKNNEPLKTSVIRMILSAVNYKKIELQREVTDEDIVTVIRKQVKQHEESIAMFQKGNRQDLTNQEEKEMIILKNYLPEELSDEKLKEEVKKTIAKIQSQIPADQNSRLIGLVIKELKNKAESSRIAAIVKKVMVNS